MKEARVEYNSKLAKNWNKKIKIEKKEILKKEKRNNWINVKTKQNTSKP